MRGFVPAGAIGLLIAACSSEPAPAPAAPNVPQAPAAEAVEAAPPAPEPVRAESPASRLAAIVAAVTRWRTAPDLPAARRAAEEARNLVVGPGGPFYGDGDRDGAVAGTSTSGLLPGLRGEAGLASGSASECVRCDVLGGDWADPARRWAILEAAMPPGGRRATPSRRSPAMRSGSSAGRR